MIELWSDIQRGKSCQIWCDGLKVNIDEKDSRKQAGAKSKKVELSKKKLPTQKDREEKISSYLTQLKQKTQWEIYSYAVPDMVQDESLWDLYQFRWTTF